MTLLNSESQKKEIWSITELTHRIRGKIEPGFASIWIQGEISNFRPASSGHLYFSLKDSQSTISAAIFGWGTKLKTRFEIKEGMEMICHGKISIYPPRGSYQIIIDHVEPLGAGALQLAFEQLKEKLKREGLFDPQSKKAIPKLPKKVAIITSPTGAALQDMLTVMNRRAPGVEILVIPALVQGDQAAAQIVKGLQLVDRHQLADVVVLARGGGSLEDLWCFNDEKLAWAIASCSVPVVSAVGHEIDFTIADFVADLRAPTPSAAGEILTAGWLEIVAQLQTLQERIVLGMRRKIIDAENRLQHLSSRLRSPRDLIREKMQRADEISMRLQAAIRVKLEKSRYQYELWAGKLNMLSPLRVLERGFTLTFRNDGKEVIRSANQLETQDEIRIRFKDGEKKALVL